jgi:glutathione peroxidase-family protein
MINFKDKLLKTEQNKYPFGTIFFTRQKVVLEGENTSPLVKCMITTKDYNWYNAVCEEDVEGMDCNWNIHKSKSTTVLEKELDKQFNNSEYLPTQEDIEWGNKTKQEYVLRWEELDEMFSKYKG